MSESSVITNKCPNCGGPLFFEPKDQQFHCEYCGSTFTETQVNEIAEKQADTGIKTEASIDEKAIENTATASTPDAVSADEKGQTEKPAEKSQVGIFLCPSCGAEIVTDATTASTFCFYCQNPVILTDRLSGEFLPEKVLPFQIERQEAEEEFLDWVGKKKFVPKAFFNKKQIEKLSGVYFPYWAVDADLTGDLSARGRNIRVWVQGDTEFTETSDYQITRAGDSHLSDLVKNALRKNLADKLVGAVEPFDLTQTKPFKNQYLSGFLTEKRDIEFPEMKSKVEQEVQNYAAQMMQNTIHGYTTVTRVSANQTLQDMKEAYVLLPIWLLTYRQAGSDKLFYYAMNGQTGKVAGVLPIDKSKLAWVTALLFLLILAIGLGVGYFLS